LQEKLQLEVRKFQGFDRATGDAVTSAPTFAENVMSFGVAYGLALQALKQTRLQTNLLPQEIRMEREIRKKKPWFVTAAACLLLGLTLLAFARGVEKNAVVNPAITEELKNLKKKVAEQKKQKDDFEAAERNLQNTLGSLNQIGAGVNERFNWQHLHQYMNFVLPQPNGDRLVSSSTGNVNVWEKYWKLNKNSQDAYAQLQKKIFSLTEVDPAEADKRDRFIKQHLLQVNIVGINALYSEDLAGYFRILHRDGPKLVGMTDEERERATELALVKDNEIEKIKKLPIFENKDGTSWQEGWVVEIRGYTTYQHLNEKADRFIEDTLIENLKRPDLLLNTDGKIIPVPKHIKLIRNRDERDRVGYFNLYKTLEVPNPVAGQYKLIGKSFLKTLIKGIDPPKAADANAPAVPPNPGQGDQGAPKVNRSTWMPVGEAAASIYGDVALGGLGGGNQGNQQGNQPAAGPHRTEFVVLFVWREPVTPTGQASTEKKN
jgi:type IV pilus assembly protein PilM